MKNSITLAFGLVLALGHVACGDDGGNTPGVDTGPNTKDSGFVTFDSGVVDTDTGVGPTDTGVVETDSGVSADTGTPPNCDHNPNGCVTNQLRSAPPACTCLAGCEAGYNWTGTACESTTPADAGSPDASEPTDTGTPADAGEDPDAAPADAAPADATPADTGVVVDGGVPADAGDLPDAGFGFGADENEACNPQADDCRQRPGLVCQNLDPANPNSTSGLCLATCDVGANTQNGNPDCTGIGQDCADAFDLGPTNGRCVNTVGAFEALDDSIELAVCDPAPGNLFFIPSDESSQGSPGVCWPLCLTRASSTNPDTDPPVCNPQSAYTSCNDELQLGGDPADPTLNLYGICNSVGARDGECGADRGVQCPGTDLCLFNVCRQTVGTTCTGAPACAGAGQACVELGQTAVCHQPCGINTGTPACPNGQACDLYALNGQPFESCRLASGNLGHGGDCSDILGIGTNTSECSPGAVCVEMPNSCSTDADCPWGQFCDGSTCTGFGSALCLAQCNPATNPPTSTCQAPETCEAYGLAPFDVYGLCF